MTLVAFEPLVLIAAVTLVSLNIGMDKLVIAERCTRVEFLTTHLADILVLVDMPPLVYSQRIFALKLALADLTLKISLIGVLIEMPIEIGPRHKCLIAEIARVKCTLLMNPHHMNL